MLTNFSQSDLQADDVGLNPTQTFAGMVHPSAAM